MVTVYLLHVQCVDPVNMAISTVIWLLTVSMFTVWPGCRLIQYARLWSDLVTVGLIICTFLA